MPIRLVTTLTAPVGERDALVTMIKSRNVAVMSEQGCEQFEIFLSEQSADRLVVLELWSDAASLAGHAALNASRPAFPEGLRIENQREDYIYGRTR